MFLASPKKGVSTRARDGKAGGLDKFLEVGLNKSQCRLRSFAIGGLPYLEVSHSMSSPATKSLVRDVVTGRLTAQVLELFDGIEPEDVSSVPCFVTDRRHPLTVEFSVTLVPPQSAEPVFKFLNAHSMSQVVLLDKPLVARDHHIMVY
jgi:hypothetical protein